VEYEVRTSRGLNVSLLESVCEIVSSLKGIPRRTGIIHNSTRELLLEAMLSLADYVQAFSHEAIKQNSAVLSLVEKSDPLAGFTRTMLYSLETATRAVGLLKLAVSVNEGSFRRVSLDRFLAGFHTRFAEKGLRPPSLSIEDSSLEVFIIPEVMLEAISILCQLRSPEDVLSFSVSSVEKEGQVSIRLLISGMEKPCECQDAALGIENLRSGVFDSHAECAVIFSILDASGCTVEFPGGCSDLLALSFRSS